MKKINEKLLLRLFISAAAAIVMLAVMRPAGDWLNGLGGEPLFDWRIPFKLMALVSGLMAVSAICTVFFGLFAPKTGHGRTIATLTESAIRYIAVIAGIMAALAIMGVNVTALLAGAGVVALIIGFGAESLIADVITGIFMLFEHQYEVGDIIVVGDFRGTVTRIGIRTTSITDIGGSVKIINNSDIRNLINRSSDASVAVCDLGVPYSAQAVRLAEKLLPGAIAKLYEGHRDIFPETPVYNGVQALDLGNNAAMLRVVAKVDERNIFTAQRLMNRELMLALMDGGCASPTAEIIVSHAD